MSKMQHFYKSLVNQTKAPARPGARWRKLIRITQTERALLLNLKSNLDWTIWGENQAPAAAR